MARTTHRRQGGNPREIPVTDLEAPEIEQTDSHAIGTPGGGTSSGGLAGTNFGDGSVEDEADLEDAMGSGIHDDDTFPQQPRDYEDDGR